MQIIWHKAEDILPDSDTTVIIYDPAADEPVWLGYFDGECWRNVDAMPVEPTHWADMPEGPQA